MGLRDPVVVIVGAGPAGLVTAHLLHQAGVPFAVLERQQADGLRALDTLPGTATPGGQPAQPVMRNRARPNRTESPARTVNPGPARQPLT